MPKISLLNKILISLFLITVVLWQCARDHEPAKNNLTPYPFLVPKGFPSPYLSANNPMTVEGVLLGRKLFYDNILSSNGRSCNSCHLQENSFMVKNSDNYLDPNIYLNIPPLINLAWNPDFGWYGVEPDLDHIAVGDFGPLFFNSDMKKVISNVKSNSEYAQLYQKVFPDEEVFTENYFADKTAQAIAQFLRSIVSASSRYDKFMMGKAVFSQEEQYGFELFNSEKGDCFHCHSAPLFTDNLYHNIGVDSVFNVAFNSGRYLITSNQIDFGKFSTPTLRNIALTGPYMHDGRFATLDEAIEHYNSKVHSTSSLDPIMTKNNKSTKLNLTAFDKLCIKKFLETLTDSLLLSNPNYGKPK